MLNFDTIKHSANERKYVHNSAYYPFAAKSTFFSYSIMNFNNLSFLKTFPKKPPLPIGQMKDNSIAQLQLPLALSYHTRISLDTTPNH